MKLFYLIFALMILPVHTGSAINAVEINFDKQTLQLKDFAVGKVLLSGDVTYRLIHEKGSLTVIVESPLLHINGYAVNDVSIKIVKTGNMFFIEYFRCPQFTLTGHYDCIKKNLLLHITAAIQASQFPQPIAGPSANAEEDTMKSSGIWEKLSRIHGILQADFKVWGSFDNLLSSGAIKITEGIYDKYEFSQLVLNFLGKPPVLNLTDSEIILKDGSSFQIEGVLNIKDFDNLFPKSEVITRKISVDGWQLATEETEGAGFKKDVSGDFNIVLDAYDESDQRGLEPGTELRYKVRPEGFLRLRMQEDKTIVGFEQKKEF